MSIIDVLHRLDAGRLSMVWKVADAKQRFSELIRRSREEPQLVQRRDELVAVVVAPETWERARESTDKSHSTLGESAAAVRRILVEEDYVLQPGERSDRPNPFAEAP